jgi:hypothetical protein
MSAVAIADLDTFDIVHGSLSPNNDEILVKTNSPMIGDSIETSIRYEEKLDLYRTLIYRTIHTTGDDTDLNMTALQLEKYNRTQWLKLLAFRKGMK